MKIFRNVVVPITGLFFVLFFMGCKEGQATKSKADFHMAIADSLISQYNARHPANEQYIKTEGKVNIINSDSILTIEYNPDNAEETATYFLYTKLKYPELKSGPFGQAEVIYLDRNLIVNSLESGRILFFSISGEQDPGYLNDLKNVHQYQGYGLGYRKVNKGSSADTVPYCSCEPNGSRDDLCATGGESALSCSTGNAGGSCRVSCSGQTFPCCDKKMD